jgi:hypothetical protein
VATPGLLPTKMEELSTSQMGSQSAGGTTLLHALPWIHPTLFMSVPCATTLTTQCRAALETDYLHITTPYFAEAWVVALNDYNLQCKYPNLVHNMVFGSPIGNPPPLAYTFVPNSLVSANEHSNIVDTHFAQEVAAGRMTGPYLLEEAAVLFHGHFVLPRLGSSKNLQGAENGA